MLRFSQQGWVLPCWPSGGSSCHGDFLTLCCHDTHQRHRWVCAYMVGLRTWPLVLRFSDHAGIQGLSPSASGGWGYSSVQDNPWSNPQQQQKKLGLANVCLPRETPYVNVVGTEPSGGSFPGLLPRSSCTLGTLQTVLSEVGASHSLSFSILFGGWGSISVLKRPFFPQNLLSSLGWCWWGNHWGQPLEHTQELLQKEKCRLRPFTQVTESGQCQPDQCLWRVPPTSPAGWGNLREKWTRLSPLPVTVAVSVNIRE